MPHRVVLTYGRFDHLTQHHITFLRKLSAMGDELIVGCTTDDFDHYQGAQGFEARRAMLDSCRFVSRVIAQETADQIHTDIMNYNVSLLLMSDDWHGKFDHLSDITQVYYLSGYRDQAGLLDIQAA